MTTNTTKKAAGASNPNGLHTNTNKLNFCTDGTPCKALAHPSVSNPDKTAVLAALAVPSKPVDEATLRALTSKAMKKIYEIHEMMCGDFLVYTENHTVYCKDLQAVQALVRKLGVTK